MSATKIVKQAIRDGGKGALQGVALQIWEQTKQREIMLERHREELIAALEKVLASANPNNSAMLQAWAFAQATLCRVKKEVEA